MKISLGELLPLIDENRTVIIRNAEVPEEELARYDGRDSIDKEFNSTVVRHINVEDNALIIYVN